MSQENNELRQQMADVSHERDLLRALLKRVIDPSVLAFGQLAPLQAEIERLKEQLDELEVDASRYRWLRDPDQDVALVLDKKTGHVPVDEQGYGGYGVYEYRAGYELDKAIDDAMIKPAGSEKV